MPDSSHRVRVCVCEALIFCGKRKAEGDDRLMTTAESPIIPIYEIFLNR